MSTFGFLVTESQRKALAEVPFEGTVLFDSFANQGDTGPLFLMQPEGREIVIHEDGQVVDGEGAELRPGVAA